MYKDSRHTLVILALSLIGIIIDTKGLLCSYFIKYEVVLGLSNTVPFIFLLFRVSSRAFLPAI